MATGKRVDELEEEIDELKATVQGLTEELVEAHERIRQIERALAGDQEAARKAAREAASEVAAGLETHAGGADGADPEEVARAAAKAESGAESGDGIDLEGAVEADKREGADGADEAEGEGDDIIVA